MFERSITNVLSHRRGVGTDLHLTSPSQNEGVIIRRVRQLSGDDDPIEIYDRARRIYDRARRNTHRRAAEIL